MRTALSVSLVSHDDSTVEGAYFKTGGLSSLAISGRSICRRTKGPRNPALFNECVFDPDMSNWL